MRIVRCPFCHTAYNIEGIAEGVYLRCRGCTALLLLPHQSTVSSKSWLSKRLLAFATAGVSVTLILTFLLLKGPPSPQKQKGTLEISNIPRDIKPAVIAKKNALSEMEERLFQIVESPWKNEADALIQKLHAEFDRVTSFSINYSKPYLIAIENDERIALTDTLSERYTKTLLALHDYFMKEFQISSSASVEEVLPIIIFKSRESFDEYFRKRGQTPPSKTVGGIYLPVKRRVMLYREDGSLNPNYASLIHEGVHQLVHHLIGYSQKPQSFWFHEGLALYFESWNAGNTGDKTIARFLDKERLSELKTVIMEKRWIPLKDFITLSINDFDSNKNGSKDAAHIYYAQAWGLVYFLCHYHEGKYKTAFNNYVQKELHSANDYEDFIRSFDNLQDLEERFVEYIKEIK